MAMAMDPKVRTEQLKNLAAVMILGDAGLTDELTDKEAKSLLDMGMQQADAAVDALLASTGPEGLPPDEAEEMIAERMAPVRRFLGAVNALVGKRHGLASQQMIEELEALRAAAQELPLPPEAPVSDSALSLLAHWPTETETLGFVLAVLHVFGPEHVAEDDAGDESRR
jgi:hypothetical protein